MREGLTRLGRPTGTQTHPLHSHTLTGISDTADKDVTPATPPLPYRLLFGP